MILENPFNNLNGEQENQVEQPEVLDVEPRIEDEVPELGNYNRDELIAAINKARE